MLLSLHIRIEFLQFVVEDKEGTLFFLSVHIIRTSVQSLMPKEITVYSWEILVIKALVCIYLFHFLCSTQYASSTSVQCLFFLPVLASSSYKKYKNFASYLEDTRKITFPVFLELLSRHSEKRRYRKFCFPPSSLRSSRLIVLTWGQGSAVEKLVTGLARLVGKYLGASQKAICHHIVLHQVMDPLLNRNTLRLFKADWCPWFMLCQTFFL